MEKCCLPACSHSWASLCTYAIQDHFPRGGFIFTGLVASYVNLQSRECSYGFTYKPILWKHFPNWGSSPQVLVCVKLTGKVNHPSDGGPSYFSIWSSLEILLYLLSLSFVLGYYLTLFYLLKQQSYLPLTDNPQRYQANRGNGQEPYWNVCFRPQSHMDTCETWNNQDREHPSRSLGNPPVQIHY